MYEVHGSPLSRMTRVTWMLEELGQEYEIKPAKLGRGELKDLNPSDKGPVLVDGDFVLTDSAGICLYLGEQHPEMEMGPQDARERAVMTSWMLYALSEFEAPMWNKLKHRLLMPEALRAEIGPWVNAEFAREEKVLSRRLGDHEFAVGDRFTCVDVVLGHCGMWARSGKFEIEQQNVSEYFDRLLSRPAYLRAVETEKALKTTS